MGSEPPAAGARRATPQGQSERGSSPPPSAGVATSGVGFPTVHQLLWCARSRYTYTGCKLTTVVAVWVCAPTYSKAYGVRGIRKMRYRYSLV